VRAFHSLRFARRVLLLLLLLLLFAAAAAASIRAFPSCFPAFESSSFVPSLHSSPSINSLTTTL
jgi:hypothetical protein